jgi:hypothetical protein
MNNDTLIDQARHLYAALHVEQARSIANKTRFDRLERMIIRSYCRYGRRLNRCVLCYQHRVHRCVWESWDKDRKACPMRIRYLQNQSRLQQSP